VTRGHEDIIHRSLHLADKLLVAVAVSQDKEPLFSLDERVELLQTALGSERRVEVCSFDGLLADFARAQNARIIIRGLRAFFLVPALHLTYLSSSLVREVARLRGEVSTLVHPAVDKALKEKFGR
jgi:pantetheine-phosphate adenylyltransferase